MVMPPMTLPNMMPTRGTMTTSLNWMRWMNQTKTQVPRMAQAKAKNARLHRVEDGINSRASKMPNWAEEMVAPVVGETNLLLHSCCMIRPATLIPTPVHRMAKSRGSREMRNTSHCSPSPASRLCGLMSSTPTNRERPERIARIPPRTKVVLCVAIPVPSSSVISYD